MKQDATRDLKLIGYYNQLQLRAQLASLYLFWGSLVDFAGIYGYNRNSAFIDTFRYQSSFTLSQGKRV